MTASTIASKELTQAIGARNLTEISQFAPGVLIGVGTRLAGRFARRVGVINTVVTNVPGPREPLYFAGAELVRSFGGGPVVDGMGLINIVSSYVDQFMLMFTADRAMMPDPAHYADCISESFEDAPRGELTRRHPQRPFGQLLRRASRVSRATVRAAGRSEPNWA